MRGKLVFLCGPPRSGKDFSAGLIRSSIRDGRAYLWKFADVLKRRTHALYGLEGYDAAHFEDSKDEPQDVFLGLTPRRAYISVSEQYYKPIHGERVFGNLLLDEMEKRVGAAEGIHVVSDSGFIHEALPVAAQFGLSNCLLVHLRRDGCTFDGDSRSYWVVDGIRLVLVDNPGTEEGLLEQLRPVLEWIRGG